MNDHPMHDVGSMALLLIDGVVYVAGRQADGLNACTSPLPDALMALATSGGGAACKEITGWIISEPRRFVLVGEDRSVSVIDVEHMVSVGGGVSAGVATPLSLNEVDGDEAVIKLAFQMHVLGRQLFASWAEHDDLAQLDALAPSLMELGKGAALEA